MGILSGEEVSVTARLINPCRSAPGSPRGAAGAAGRRGRPRGTALAPASRSPRSKSDPLRSEHLLGQRRWGRTEGEAAPTATLWLSSAPPFETPPRWSPWPRLLATPPGSASNARHLFAQNTSTLADKSSFPVLPSPPDPKLTYPLVPSTTRLQDHHPLLSGPSPKQPKTALCSLGPHPDWPEPSGSRRLLSLPFPSPQCLEAVLPFCDWLSAVLQAFLGSPRPY